MKLDTIASPSRYDAVACLAIKSANLQRPTILHYATFGGCFTISRDGPVTPSIAALSVNAIFG